MRKLRNSPLTVGLLLASVMTVTGCTTSAPANVSSLTNVLGQKLPGTKGLTLQDQRNIDETVAGACGSKLYSGSLCDKHTQASASRKRELRNANQ